MAKFEWMETPPRDKLRYRYKYRESNGGFQVSSILYSPVGTEGRHKVSSIIRTRQKRRNWRAATFSSFAVGTATAHSSALHLIQFRRFWRVRIILLTLSG